MDLLSIFDSLKRADLESKIFIESDCAYHSKVRYLLARKRVGSTKTGGM